MAYERTGWVVQWRWVRVPDGNAYPWMDAVADGPPRVVPAFFNIKPDAYALVRELKARWGKPARGGPRHEYRVVRARVVIDHEG